MTPTPSVRTQPCSGADAVRRLGHARKFLEVAQLIADEGSDPEYASVATALAVLAGIAASDAACCKALGQRPRGQNHHEAVTLVDRLTDGQAAAKTLSRLLSIKDEAHYGLFDVSASGLKAALRQATQLVEFASKVLRR